MDSRPMQLNLNEHDGRHPGMPLGHIQVSIEKTASCIGLEEWSKSVTKFHSHVTENVQH
jgi:hypothetical protein